MREGWKCPVCGKGVSPDEKSCDHAVATLPPVIVPIYPVSPTPIDPWPYPPHLPRPLSPFTKLYGVEIVLADDVA